MRWWGPLGLLAAIRVAIPLAAYADAGSGLPGLPAFVRQARDGGLTGDATGFYAATREFMAAWGRMPRAVLALDALLALGAAVALVLLWRRRPALRPWLVPAALCAFGLVVCVDVHWMKPSGAAVFGWPLLWSLPMFAYRALGVGLSKHVAWDFGFVLSLGCVALTVVAVGYLGRNASARRWVGLLAAAFWTSWPLLVGLIAGHHAWTNGQWEVDAGLHNYSEPLSTLLVTAGAALVLSPQLTQMRLALAGCALSAATLVKLSNALLATAALAVVFLRGRTRDTLPYLAGALALAPLVAVYWPISYPKLFNNPQSWPRDPFDAGHIVSSWTHSSIFTPHTLAIVVPLAAIGVAAILRPWALALVLAFLLVNPVFYSFYANTAQHPRFLYASLPELFVLWAAGIALLVRAALAQPWRARGFAR
jgi:succinate dehydrogenase hydrophobic anchor subunit